MLRATLSVICNVYISLLGHYLSIKRIAGRGWIKHEKQQIFPVSFFFFFFFLSFFSLFFFFWRKRKALSHCGRSTGATHSVCITLIFKWNYFNEIYLQRGDARDKETEMLSFFAPRHCCRNFFKSHTSEQTSHSCPLDELESILRQ